MSLSNNDEISPQSSPLQDSLEVGTNDSMIATSLINDDTLRAKRRGRKPKYPDPTPGYRSSYSVNRSFTQTEVQLLKHILKDAGEPPADLFATRVWPPSPHPSHHHHQHSHHQEHHQAIMPNNDQCDVKIDSTMVFPVNEENPKNQELLLNARRKRSRNVTSPYQSRVLRKVLAVTSFPSTEMREALANALNMHPRTVQIWFQNQRQKAKNNPQAVGSQINGMTQIDEYSPELLPINISPAVPSTIFFHNNLNIFPNNNVNVVQNAIGTQSAASLPPSSATDDLRQTNDNVTQTHSMSTTDKDSGQLQVAQNFVPVATYINQFTAAAPYAILPIFQTNGAAAQFHHASQQQQQQQHHHHHHQPQSSPTSNQSSYFHQSTLQFPVYQQPHPVTPQQQPHHQSHPSPQSSPNDPPLNILAAAALQAEGDPTQQHHHPGHHQAQPISGRYVHSAASVNVMNHPIVVSSPVVGDW